LSNINLGGFVMLRRAALVAACVLMAAAAQGADMRGRGAPPPPLPGPSLIAPIPISQWNGFYVGLNGGYGWGRSSHTATIAPGGSTGDFDTDGGLNGGTVG
jgi:outer membrane immunogenic protein